MYSGVINEVIDKFAHARTCGVDAFSGFHMMIQILGLTNKMSSHQSS